MFKKVLIANRGEIAARIIRTCGEMGIATVSLYQQPDIRSLHVWMADECVRLESPIGFFDQNEIIKIALQKGVDAIHPGYGFLAEREDFARRCSDAGITIIGPPVETLAKVRHKLKVLREAHNAGIRVPVTSNEGFDGQDLPRLKAEAERLGFPLMVKSSRGGRGRGSRLIWSTERLMRTVRRAHAESRLFYGKRRVYLEKAIVPAHQIGVQIIGDNHGKLIHLGEREGSLLYGNQKIIEESPAPCLDEVSRLELCETALKIARLFEYRNVGTVEFLVNGDGESYFTEIKPRIQIEHPLTEMRSRKDIVRAQILISAGEALDFNQQDVNFMGWAIQCRIHASNPWSGMPSPGQIVQLRLPGGQDVRSDTYLYRGCNVPEDYDPLVCKLIVGADNRESCIRRMEIALREFQLDGVETNLPLIQQMFNHPRFRNGTYDTEILMGGSEHPPLEEIKLRDLAIISGIHYTLEQHRPRTETPERLLRGWHKQSRRV